MALKRLTFFTVGLGEVILVWITVYEICLFFGVENRQLLGELNGIDTLLQCLSVSANTSYFFNSKMYINFTLALILRQ